MSPRTAPRETTAAQVTAADVTAADVTATLRAQAPATIDVGHARLAHYKFGAGPDLVFVHGWPLHAATFRAIVPELARSFTCHLIDLPGAGRSSYTPATRFGIRAHADTLRRAVDALGLDRYGLVAHDSGAGMARYLMADDPRACGLVSGDTEIPGHTPWIVSLYQLALKIPGGVASTRMLLGMGAVRRSPLGFAGCFTDPGFVDGDFTEWFVRPLLEDRAALDGQMKLLVAIDPGEVRELADVHRRIRVPVRLVWGTDDPIFPIAKARRMLSEFTAPVELIEVPGGRAFLHEDHAPLFAQHVREHLTKCLDGR